MPSEPSLACAGNLGTGQRPIHDDPALLIVPHDVAGDVSLGRAGESKVDRDAVPITIERRLANVVDRRIAYIDVGTVIHDTKVVGSMNAGAIDVSFRLFC